MLVKAWKNGKDKKSTYGIKIDIEDRNKYFIKSWTQVVIDINGTPHTCSITNGFWDKCPEIRDQSIKAWFTLNNNLTWPNGSPPQFNLDHVSGNNFQLY